MKPLLFKQERISGRLSELLIHALPEDVSVWMEGRAIVTTQSGSMTCSGYPRNEASTNPSGHPSLASASASSNNTASTIHFASPMTYPAARAIEVFPEQHCPTGGRSNRESRNDYYRARYYSSNDARFMSPDWSSDPEAVPYAKLKNPQSLNLYEYMLDSPLGGVDKDGHACIFGFTIFGSAFGGRCPGSSKPAPATPQPPPPDPAGQVVDPGLPVPWKLCSAKCNNQQQKNDQNTQRQQLRKDSSGAQDKKLTGDGVDNLEKNTGQTAHEIKADALGTKKNISKYDLYSNSRGEIVVKPKGSSGAGEPTGYTTEQLKSTQP